MRAVSPTKNKRRVEKSETQTLNKKVENPKHNFTPRFPLPRGFLITIQKRNTRHQARVRDKQREREREREIERRERGNSSRSFFSAVHTHAREMNTHVSSSAESSSSKTMMMMNERERLLASSSSRADGEDDTFSTRFASKRWKAFAVIGSLSLVAAFAGYSSVTSIHNNGVLGSAMHAYGSKEAGASAASRAATKALPVRTAQLGYADVDLDTSALGAKERNMIQASLAIEEVQRKIKRLEKAKRQRALNIQDEDDYLEDEVVPGAAEGESDAVETATESEVEEGESDGEKSEDLKEQEDADERNAAVKMLTGEDPVVGEDEPKEEESGDDDKEEEEEALPQVMASFVDQKLEEELKEEEKNNDASANSEESAKEEKDSLEEMALAFQKEMERTALEEELTATPNEKEVEEGNEETEVTAEDETTAPETDEAMAEKEEEKEEAEEEEKEEETEASTEASVSEEGNDEQKQKEATESMRAATQLSSLLKGSTKRDLSDSEFSKLEKLLQYNAEKRGIQLKASSSADTTPAQPPKAELCPTSAIYAGRCECSTCALVLPMPDMVGTSLGKEIDSHECVARMNAQYIEVQNSSLANKLANPRDYGSKTDFVFSNVVEHTLNDLIENLNTTKGKKLNQKVKHKFLHVPFWRPAPEVFDFLEAHNDWKTIPHAVTKETTDLFAQMKGAEGKQWSSGFLAYVMLSRHYCAKTTVYSYWRAEEDPKSQAYVTNSKGGARKMWSGHSFGGEHEFIKNAAENHDYGTRVRYLDALKEGAKREEEVGGIVP